MERRAPTTSSAATTGHQDRPGGNNFIQGNLIGTAAAGTAGLPNQPDNYYGGVDIESAGASPSTGNLIGGTAAGDGNIISGRNFGTTVGAGDGVDQLHGWRQVPEPLTRTTAEARAG